MSKSQSKQRKKGSGAPAIPPASSLRPRLDARWSSATLPEQDQDAVYADLDAITLGIKPALFLPIMLRAYSAAPPAAQARLDEMLPAWLQERGYGGVLEELVAGGGIAIEQQQQAVDWLAAIGGDPDTLAALAEWDHFFRADFTGDESQAALLLLWYTNRQQQRVQGFNFLIDYNPPWEGSVKDIIAYPQRSPQAAVAEFVDTWRARMHQPVEQIDAVEAKQTILDALVCNRAAEIRLPQDLITSRDLFLRYVLTLPDGPDTPAFTDEDFDALSRNGERPETIMHFEQTVGRRVRMADGQEVLIMGGGLDPDE
jgi:hypothetical protein